MSKIEQHNENEFMQKSHYYNQIFENSSDVIYLVEVTPEGRFIHKDVNNAYCKVTALSREEILSLYVDEFENREFREILLEKYSACVKAGEKTDYINEYHFPSGRRTFHSTLSPIRDDSGRIHQIIGIARDITEQKKEEVRIHKNEEEFRSLAQNYPDVVIRYDSTCRRIYVNPTFEKMAKHKADELLGKTPLDSSPLIAPKYYMSKLHKCIETQSSSEFEAASYTQTGELGWYMVSLRPEFDEEGAFISVLSVAHDITQSKEYESMLQKSSLLEKRMSKMLSNLPGFVYTYHKSKDGHYSMPYASSGIFDIFGVEPQDVIEDAFPIFKRIHPDDLRRTEEALHISTSELTPLCIEFRVQTLEYGERWIEAKSIPKKEDEKDGVIVWHGVMLDITERKEQEERIRKNKQKLQSSNDLLDSVLESSPDVVVFALDTAYNYLAFNTKHKEVMAYLWGKEISVGSNMLETIQLHTDRETAKADFDRALSGESFSVESTYGMVGVSRKHWHIFYSPIYSTEGEITGVTCFNIDITQRKETEFALHEVEAKHSLVFQESQVALAIFSLERFMYIGGNNSFFRQIGYDREEIIECAGVTFWVDKEASERFIEEIQITGKIEDFEFQYRRKDGTIRTATAYGTIIELNGECCILGENYDITERKNQAEALKNREQALNEAQRIAHVGSWDVDVVNNVLTWSDETYRIWEIDKEKFDATFEAFLETVHPEDRELVAKTYNDSLIHQTHYEVEHRLLFSDGRVKYIQERGEPHCDATGNPIRFIGTCLDITERKQMEENLAKREIEFRTLSENLPVPIFRYDREGRRTYVNHVVERLSGVNAAELTMKRPTEKSILPNSADDTRVNQSIQSVLNTGKTVIEEYHFISVDGKDMWFENTNVPEFSPDGTIMGVLTIAHDITAVKQQEKMLQAVSEAKEELQYKNSLMESIIESTDEVAIFALDREYRYLSFNKTHEEYYNKQYNTEIAIGMDFFESIKADVAFCDFCKHEFDLALGGQNFFVQSEEESKQEGEPTLYWDVYGSPIYNSNKEIIGLTILAINVTEQKEQEEQLHLKQFALDNMNEAAFLIDENAMFHYVNEAACCDLGYTKEELLTMGVIDINPNISKELWIELYNNLRNNKNTIASEHKRKDGTVFPIEVRSNYFRYNDKLYTLAIVHNVTERKKMQEQLLEQNKFLDSLLDALPVPVFYKDTETRYRGFNKAFEEFYGKKKEEMIGKGVFDLFPPEQAQVFFDADADLFRHGGTQTYEAKLHDTRGNHHDVIFHKAVYFNKSGTVIGQIGTILDITERKAQEEALAQKEQEFRALAEQTPDTIARYNKDCIRTYANPAFANISGMSDQELIGLKPTSHNRSQNALKYEEKIKKVFETRLEDEMELIWTDKRGHFITSHIRIVPEIDAYGSILSVLSIGRDITSMKEQENRLNEAQKMAKVGNWELEFPSLQLFWSEEVYRIFEISHDEYEPSYDSFLNLIHPEDRVMLDKVFAQSLQDKTAYSFTHRLLMPDKRIKYVHEKGQTFYDAQGNILRSVGTVQDITQRKTIENKMKHMAHHDSLTGLPNRIIAKAKGQ
ncbi:MAG: hypothetical protein CO085_06170, partial [Sulfurimonas sp. CG_4_9_14_0_8_um_filter_36_384]